LESDPDLLRLRDVIDRNSEVMARLLDDLMDVGRIARDKLELRPERMEVGELVRSALEACEPETTRFNHQISVAIPEEKIYVIGDPVRLGQVVGNLINNACRYTEPGGQIRLSVARADHEALISVKDSGIGISVDKLSSIFGLFSQVDASFERSQGGLGIGLHLAKRLVEMHGGHIAVSSEGLNRGSTFTVHLPALEAPATIAPSAPIAAPEASTTSASPLRVLVVDDNRDAAEMLAAVLEMDRHVVELAYDGPSAIAEAEAFRPDMVLLDIGLPLMNGFDVCQQIRRTEWGKRMKLVALTGWGQESDRARSAAAGFDAHLVKPVDHRALAEVIDSTARALAATQFESGR
jgi:CheY-like chemotaxis protein/two-component sensor histidine kinase